MTDFTINPEYADRIHWSLGSCGQSGCTDPECCCALCRKPIGVADDDSRWQEHDADCVGCELCEDAVPLILFRGKGKAMQQAAFHGKCFDQILLKPTVQ